MIIQRANGIKTAKFVNPFASSKPTDGYVMSKETFKKFLREQGSKLQKGK